MRSTVSRSFSRRSENETFSSQPDILEGTKPASVKRVRIFGDIRHRRVSLQEVRIPNELSSASVNDTDRREAIYSAYSMQNVAEHCSGLGSKGQRKSMRNNELSRPCDDSGARRFKIMSYMIAERSGSQAICGGEGDRRVVAEFTARLVPARTGPLIK